MKRRDFLTGSIAVAAAAAAPLVNAADEKHQWKMVTSLPKGLPGPCVSADRI